MVIKSKSQESIYQNIYDAEWFTDNGSYMEIRISPKQINILETGKIYTFTVNLTAKALAPNMTMFNGINFSIIFFTETFNVTTSLHTTNNMTHVGQEETYLLNLSIPLSEKLPISKSRSYRGGLYYIIEYNETFNDFSTFKYNTGWNSLSSATLYGPDSFQISSLILLLIVGLGISVALIAIYSSKKKKKILRNPNTPPNYPSESLAKPLDRPSEPPILEQTSVSKQDLPQYQQPIVPHVRMVEEKNFPQAQTVKLCTYCSTLNLPSVESCVTCGTELQYIVKQGEEKQSLFNKLILFFLRVSLLRLTILLLALQLATSVIVPELFVSAGNSLNFPLDINLKIDRTSKLYYSYSVFAFPYILLTLVITTLIFNIFSYYMMKTEILRLKNINLFKIRRIKRSYLIVPFVHAVLLLVLSFIASISLNDGSEMFFIFLIAFVFILGFFTLPIRYFFYKKRFILLTQVSYSPTHMSAGTPVNPVNNYTQPQTYVTPSTLTNSDPSPKLKFLCQNCHNMIEKSSTFCPHCGIAIEHCKVCKLPIENDNEKAYCPECHSSFHFSHLSETIKVSGACPVCRKNVQKHTILREKPEI